MIDVASWNLIAGGEFSGIRHSSFGQLKLLGTGKVEYMSFIGFTYLVILTFFSIWCYCFISCDALSAVSPHSAWIISGERMWRGPEKFLQLTAEAISELRWNKLLGEMCKPDKCGGRLLLYKLRFETSWQNLLPSSYDYKNVPWFGIPWISCQGTIVCLEQFKK